MLVSSEFNLGSRTVMEYLLSPVQKVTREAGRERQRFARLQGPSVPWSWL